MDIEKLIPTLAPLFAAGLAIQQLGEIVSPLLDRISTEYKKVVFGLISLTIGLAVAHLFQLHLLNLLLDPDNQPDKYTLLDTIITGLIISTGTEGVNSILKFMKFKKEETKNEAVRTLPGNAGAAPAAVGGVPPANALNLMNKK